MKNAIVGAVHRHLWQRLPREARRALLFRASALAAPRPDRDVAPALPLIFAGPLTTASGLGETSRLCYDTARAAGIPAFGVDLTQTLMQAPDYPGFGFEDASALEGPGTVILNANSPLVALTLMRLGRKFVANKRIIGYWAWELPRVPDDWRHGLKFVHEIWAPSRFTADAIRPIAGDKPVRFIPYPAIGAALPPRAPQRPDGRPFTVLTIFNTASSFVRKNPVAAIRAFRQAFGNDPAARFIIKTSNVNVYAPARDLLREAIGDATNIELIERSMPADELTALYYKSDCILSLHRSEGFGLVPAEGMMRGLPVVATDFSSTTDFVSKDCGFPISYTLIPARDPQGTYEYPGMVWADPDVGEAAAALKTLRDNPALCRTLGDYGRDFSLRTWSGPAFIDAARGLLGL